MVASGLRLPCMCPPPPPPSTPTGRVGSVPTPFLAVLGSGPVGVVLLGACRGGTACCPPPLVCWRGARCCGMGAGPPRSTGGLPRLLGSPQMLALCPHPVALLSWGWGRAVGRDRRRGGLQGWVRTEPPRPPSHVPRAEPVSPPPPSSCVPRQGEGSRGSPGRGEPPAPCRGGGGPAGCMNVAVAFVRGLSVRVCPSVRVSISQE